MSLSNDHLYHLLAENQAAYVRCIDDDALESWPDFFDEVCHYRITTADNHRRGLEAGLMYADSKGMLRDRISALREANIYEQQSYRHVLSPPLIRTRESNGISSETSFLVARIMRTGETELFVTGRYFDRYRIDGERLLIRERIVACDSARIDTLLALPL